MQKYDIYLQISMQKYDIYLQISMQKYLFMLLNREKYQLRLLYLYFNNQGYGLPTLLYIIIATLFLMIIKSIFDNNNYFW